MWLTGELSRWRDNMGSLGRSSERGAIRLRTVVEILFLSVTAYVAFQVVPAVKLRIQFLNEMEVAAYAPIEKTGGQIKADLLKTAERFGLTILSEDLYVERNAGEKRTFIRAEYQIYINFWPRFTYVWNVTDQVEGYYL